MQVITPFIQLIMNSLPSFLMAEPIIYFVSIFILASVIKLIITIFHA